MTQGTHVSGHQTIYTKEIVLGREADEYYDFDHSSLITEIARIIFTARKVYGGGGDGIGDVVMQLSTSTNGLQWKYDEENYKARIYFWDTDTVGLRAANNETDLVYDIEMLHADGSKYTVERGSLRIEYDVTHDDSTATYLSWQTLADLETEIDGYAAGFDRTFMSADATTGATTIYVTTHSIFNVGDDIRIILDDGTYDQRTVATIDTDDSYLTFSGGLTSAASENNVVMRVI